jgi:type IV secretory pathway TraG/TraD family ATPase VirD4
MNSMRVILLTWCQIKRTSLSLRYVKFGPGHIQCIYSSAYWVFNIHLNVSALILYISRQFNVGYTANLVPNAAHIVQFTLCEMWCRTYTKYLQLRIFMLQNSAVCICAAIVDITWILCALYCKLSAKDSANPPVYAMWPVVPAIYNVFAAPHI